MQDYSKSHWMIVGWGVLFDGIVEELVGEGAPKGRPRSDNHLFAAVIAHGRVLQGRHCLLRVVNVLATIALELGDVPKGSGES